MAGTIDLAAMEDLLWYCDGRCKRYDEEPPHNDYERGKAEAWKEIRNRVRIVIAEW